MSEPASSSPLGRKLNTLTRLQQKRKERKLQRQTGLTEKERREVEKPKEFIPTTSKEVESKENEKPALKEPPPDNQKRLDEIEENVQTEKKAMLDPKTGIRDCITEDAADKAARIAVALRMYQQSVAMKQGRPLTQSEFDAFIESRVQSIEMADRAQRAKINPKDQERLDRQLEKEHEQMLAAAKREAELKGMPAEEVARITLVSLLRAKNRAAGKTGPVILTKREMEQEKKRMQVEQQATSVLEFMKRMRKSDQVAEEYVKHSSQKDEDELGLSAKSLSRRERAKQKMLRDAELIAEHRERAEALQKDEAARIRMETSRKFNNALAVLQVEWKSIPTIPGEARPRDFMAYHDWRRDEDARRFTQFIYYHSARFWSIVNGHRKSGVPVLDDAQQTIATEKDSPVFIDFEVPAEHIRASSYAWNLLTIGSRETRVVTLTEVEKFAEEVRAGTRKYDSDYDRQQAKSLIKHVKEHDPQNEFVARLTLQCAPVDQGLMGITKTIVTVIPYSAYKHRDDIAKIGPQKEYPPMCKFEQCNGLCLRPVSGLPSCAKCKLPGEKRQKVLYFCSNECKEEHHAVYHPDTLAYAKKQKELWDKKQQTYLTLAQAKHEARQQRAYLEIARGTKDPETGKITKGQDILRGTGYSDVRFLDTLFPIPEQACPASSSPACASSAN